MAYLVISNDEQFVAMMTSLLHGDVVQCLQMEEVLAQTDLKAQLIIWQQPQPTSKTLMQCEQLFQRHVPILYFTDDMTNMVEQIIPFVFDFFVMPYHTQYIATKIQTAMQYGLNMKSLQQQKRFLEKDLQTAKNVQKSALTPSLYKKNIQVDGFYVTSHVLGGDMYCWFEVSEHQTAIILYDVMGHGVASSLVTMSIRSLLRGMMTRLADPDLVVQELNRHINELYKDEYMDSYLVTAIYLLVDTKANTLQYVNAGHPTGYVFNECGECIELKANAPILGLLPMLKIQKKELPLHDYARIVLYTDGLQQEDECVDSAQFLPYIAQSNVADLRNFVENQQLANMQQLDDISLVFITVST
ncbi:MAG: PP2C family protein-serine/threonine phosphatase [Caryophanon sp.]|nr:PP2C family protein-serine/threonine phosphatase [Caryophanon sp.]